ncbi:MAG TPA: hypothetical protein PKW36_06790 [bacterium]|nr:hypothetical protein [bacterium]
MDIKSNDSRITFRVSRAERAAILEVMARDLRAGIDTVATPSEFIREAVRYYLNKKLAVHGMEYMSEAVPA